MQVEAVDLLNSKDGQAIEIPKEFIIDDDKVYLKKTGNIITIIPYHNPWQNFYDSLAFFTPDFMESRSQPDQQSRETFDS